MPGCILIYILPEIKNMGAELIVIRHRLEETVTIITSQREVLRSDAKFRVRLCCGKSRIPIL